jgi:hypothetical protein
MYSPSYALPCVAYQPSDTRARAAGRCGEVACLQQRAALGGYCALLASTAAPSLAGLHLQDPKPAEVLHNPSSRVATWNCFHPARMLCKCQGVAVHQVHLASSALPGVEFDAHSPSSNIVEDVSSAGAVRKSSGRSAGSGWTWCAARQASMLQASEISCQA